MQNWNFVQQSHRPTFLALNFHGQDGWIFFSSFHLLSILLQPLTQDADSRQRTDLDSVKKGKKMGELKTGGSSLLFQKEQQKSSFIVPLQN